MEVEPSLQMAMTGVSVTPYHGLGLAWFAMSQMRRTAKGEAWYQTLVGLNSNYLKIEAKVNSLTTVVPSQKEL